MLLEKTISPELERQRNLSKINRQELAHLVLRGKDRWDLYTSMQQRVLATGQWNNPFVHEKSREEIFAEMEEKSTLVYKASKADNINANYCYETSQATNLHLRGSVGIAMCIQLIVVMGTEEQKALFLPELDQFRWVSAYVQTELGHGSDVEGIETTAVFDEKTDSFIINTPTIEAIKWWPGDLAISATHILLIARLISQGKDHSVQCFFFQVRDIKTHELLPGIESGDIGAKLGYNSKDNGFMKFTNFRVPKVSLLSKYIHVSKDGTVTKSGNERLKFTGMMKARTLLLMTSYYNMLRALTITTRYSVVRKQFLDSNNQEIKIIDYQLQQHKIAKNLSKTYAMAMGLYQVMDLIGKNSEAVANGDYSYFQQIHLLLCECKAFYTQWDNQCITECIQACGGHGYAYTSGLVTPYTENFPNMILEGENSLLCLQVARYMLTLAGKIAKGDTSAATGQFSYLLKMDELEEFAVPAAKEFLTDFQNILKILQKNAAFFLKKTSMGFMQHTLEGLDLKKVFNTKMGVQLVNMARCHTIYVHAESFFSKIASLNPGPIKDAFTSLGIVFTGEIFKDFGANLFESESLNAELATSMVDMVDEHVEKLYPDLLVLSEALQIPDEILGSAIGHSNGKPYENLYTWATKLGSLNQFVDRIHPVILKHKKQLLDQRL